MQNISSGSELYDALSAAVTLLAKQRIFGLEIRYTKNGQRAWVKGLTIDGRSLYAEIVTGSSTNEENGSGGKAKE